MVLDPSYRDFLEELATRRFSPEANDRCQWLMGRNNFGELTVNVCGAACAQAWPAEMQRTRIANTAPRVTSPMGPD